MPDSKNVLAVFCRAPQWGQVKTRLAASLGANLVLELYRAMLNDTFNWAREVENCVTIPILTPNGADISEFCSEPPIFQSDGDLGARLLAADGQLRTRGFQNVVFIGADSPDLPPQLVESAFEKLRRSDCVLGSAHDGGYYLIGAAKPLDPMLWNGVVWSSENVLSRTLANACQLGWRTELLAMWRDVDEKADLEALHKRLLRGESVAPHVARVLAKLS